MAVTQKELAAQMLAQLRVLDPSISAEIGTPERKIIDTVSQALSDAQVDLNVLSGSLDIDSKVGSNLDNFLALFGFSRQQGTRATGFVTLSRNSASTVDIRVPAGTQVLAPSVNSGTDVSAGTQAIYQTTYGVTLPAGSLSVTAPVECSFVGSLGNVGAGAITTVVGTPVFGITEVTNDAPITGGTNVEDDDQVKVRFKNTIFRNLAGTTDQYLALAAATAFTTKANVVGPMSRYREYIQVPPVDDTEAYDVQDDSGSAAETTGATGTAGEYTTALSTIPHSKHTYTTVPSFVTNGKTGVDTVFYREGIDWRMNTESVEKNKGDAYRFAHSDVPAIDQPGIDPTSVDATYRPNVTFTAVYTGDDDDVDAIRPEQVVLFEHSYLSSASRNDLDHNVSNCVDVFIDGTNPVVSSTLVPAPGATPTAVFNNTDTDKLYYKNYRRIGEDDTPPAEDNWFVPLFWQPVVDLPASITVLGELNDNSVKTTTYYLGVHYWLVEDISELYGTIRARNGIEWDLAAAGHSATDPVTSIPPSVSDTYSGAAISDYKETESILIENYTYNKNVTDLQAACESAKQVTTDVLIHQARTRYFKLDITVMYSAGANPTSVNTDIQNAVSSFFGGQYFGNIIQLSDLLQVIHNVTGVDNVRWSSDIPGTSDTDRVIACTASGVPLSSRIVNGEEEAWDGSINTDFFLKDDELPSLPEDAYGSDTLAGLRIRSRAQNSWTRG